MAIFSYAQPRKIRQLQNQNTLLNHSAAPTKYQILPERFNKPFRRNTSNVPDCWTLGIFTLLFWKQKNPFRSTIGFALIYFRALVAFVFDSKVS